MAHIPLAADARTKHNRRLTPTAEGYRPFRTKKMFERFGKGSAA